MPHFLLFISLFFMLPLVYSANLATIGLPITQHYTKQQYKASTQNWDIAQHKNGIMYFANNKGLLHFDGQQWDCWALANKTIVRSLAMGNDSIIYVGGQGEIGYFKLPTTQPLSYVSLTALLAPAQQNFADVWEVISTPDGVYFGTNQQVFYYTNDTVQCIYQNKQSTYVHMAQVHGKQYLANSEGLHILTGGNVQAILSLNTWDIETVTGILPYSNNKLLICTAKQGIFLLDNGQLIRWDNQADAFLRQHRIYCTAYLGKDTYAIGTAHKGLVIVQSDGRVSSYLNKDSGLQNNTILSLYTDQQQNLWLGLDNGIDYVMINTPLLLMNESIGIEGTGYTALQHKELLYVGTNNGVYYTHVQSEKQQWQNNTFNLIEGTQGQVWSLNSIDSTLFLGHHEGTFVIEDKQIKQLSDINGGWTFMPVANAPNYIIGGTYTGLTLYEKREGVWQFKHKIKGFTESCRMIGQDPFSEDIWVSHAYRGAYRLQINEALDSVAYVKLYGEKDGFPSDLFVQVFNVFDGLVFSAENGIYQYNKQYDAITTHPELFDFFDEEHQVRYLVQDKANNLWFVDNEQVGTIQMNRQTFSCQLDKILFSGLQNSTVFMSAFLQPHSHGLFVGTDNGFINYQAKKGDFTTPPYKVLLRHVQNTTNKTFLYRGYPTLSDSLAQLTIPSLSYQHNNIQFRFAATDYANAKHLKYQYYLEGFDKSWSEWNAKTEKEYTNLSSGQYTFFVRATNGATRAQNTIRYQFYILPPWYASTTAMLLYTLLIAMALLALIMVPRRQHKKETAALKQAQEQHLQAQQQAFEMQNAVSNQKITQLENDKLQTEINHKTKELASTTMHLVHKSEILNGIKNTLQKLIKAINDAVLQKQLKQLIRDIDDNIALDATWQQFEQHFDSVHENFLKRLREAYPQLSPKDLKLCAYLRMNLSTKEIAPLMNISIRGVEISRYRLRKKLALDRNENLIEFMQAF